MALPSSGSISLGQVNTELGVSATATRSLNDATTRTLFGVGSGQISLSQGYGKANQFAFTISSNQTNADLRTLAINAGWNGSSKVIATINSGVYLSSNSTGTPALTVSGSFPGGVELVNNGYIIGRGGAGGNGANAPNGYNFQAPGGAGGAGGGGLSVSAGISITNNGTIAGGGGGGGGGGAAQYVAGLGSGSGGGGGGGGGRSGTTSSSGGSGGVASYGASRVNGGAGSGGSTSVTGSGGSTSIFYVEGTDCRAGAGGSGGGWGAAGSGGGQGKLSNYTVVNNGGAGGAAGYAVSGNGNVTWLATGTRLGSVS